MACGHRAEEEVGGYEDQSRQVQSEEKDYKRSRDSCNDDDNRSKLLASANQTAIEYGTATDADVAASSTGQAAFILASDLSRLASRQRTAACELLQVSSSVPAPSAGLLDHRKDPRKDPEVLNALATLGQVVVLQAKTVGLMEEVVVRTVHSRVSNERKQSQSQLTSANSSTALCIH